MKSKLVSTKDTLGGALRIDGTRISVGVIYRSMRTDAEKRIKKDHPHLTKEQIAVGLKYWDDFIYYGYSE